MAASSCSPAPARHGSPPWPSPASAIHPRSTSPSIRPRPTWSPGSVWAHPPPPPLDQELFNSITARHSNRHGYQRRAVPPSLLTQLEATARDHDCWLVPVQDPQHIATAARLIGAGDRVKWREPEFRHELAERLIPNSGPRRDGMPGYAFGVPGPLARWAPEVIRRVDLGPARSLSDRRLARATPVLLVLGTDKDDRASWVAAGFAMADVLLRAASAGLATGFLSQAIEVPELRPRVGELVQRPGFAQLLLRCGYPTRAHRRDAPWRTSLSPRAGRRRQADE